MPATAAEKITRIRTGAIYCIRETKEGIL